MSQQEAKDEDGGGGDGVRRRPSPSAGATRSALTSANSALVSLHQPGTTSRPDTSAEARTHASSSRDGGGRGGDGGHNNGSSSNGNNSSSGGAAASEHDDTVSIPDDALLLRAASLDEVASAVQQALTELRARVARGEQAMRDTMQRAVLPYQVRRAQREAAAMAQRMAAHQHTTRRLLRMQTQLDEYAQLRARVWDDTHAAVQRELAELRSEHAANASLLRAGYMDRIRLLQRYWPWRQLRELGDTAVGATFADELARGPRYRNVGVQNNLQSEQVAQQIRWLQAYAAREEHFRRNLQQLDALIGHLYDVNELLESTLTCAVCGLLYDEPVLFWPCGHAFCVLCFASLAIAPSLFRCPTCGSIGSEGYLHNLILADTVAKWVFKDAGYGDLERPIADIRMHMSRFRKDRIEATLRELKELLRRHRQREREQHASEPLITFSYRAY